jgi:hypothetical protein
LTTATGQKPSSSQLETGELEYIEGNFQGLMHLFDRGMRKWTGQMHSQQIGTQSYAWAVACVQAAEIVDEFLQTAYRVVSECGIEVENIVPCVFFTLTSGPQAV